MSSALAMLERCANGQGRSPEILLSCVAVLGFVALYVHSDKRRPSYRHSILTLKVDGPPADIVPLRRSASVRQRETA